MVTPEQMEHFRDKGWVVVEGVFDTDTVDKIAAIATAVIEEDLKQPEVSAMAGQRLESGEIIPRKIMDPFFKHYAFQEFVLNERFKSVIEEFIGDTPLLLTDQVFMKPPHHGGPKPYHQDDFYFQCFPVDHVITAWIALDDVDEENACLRYISGSHKKGIIPHYPQSVAESHNLIPPDDRIDMNNEELAPVHKGGVVFHHSQTLHSSHRNNSDRWRRAYATHWVTEDVTCKNDTLNKALFKDERYQSLLARRAV
jgi:ectoine hydroxylase-related dioxygenase (phytanoyl-CoA dioxygenase family)